MPIFYGQMRTGSVGVHMADNQKTLQQVEQDLAQASAQIEQLLEANQRSHAERVQAEQALRENQRMLATLMGNLPGMAYRCRNDRDWTMEFVSDGCLDLTGYAPSDLIDNKTVSYGHLIYPDDREQVWQSIQAALAERRKYQIIYRIVTPAGQTKWAWEQGCGVFSPQGQFQALEGMITDMTERVQAVEQIRSIAAFPDENPWPIMRTSADGMLLYANKSSTDLLADWQSEVGKNIPDHVRRFVVESVQKGEPLEADVHSQNRVFSFVFTPLAGKGYVNLYARDVTESRRTLEALRKGEEQLRIAQQAAGAGMWDWEISPNRITWSPEYYDLYGLDPSVQPSYENWLASIHEEDRRPADDAMRLAQEHCRDSRIEFRILHPKRGLRWLASIGRTFCDGNGRAIRMTGLTVDITERRQYMEQLRTLNATLEQRVAERTVVAEERATQLRMLAGQLTQAEQQERRRVAHILHEHFQQLLVAAKYNISLLRPQLVDETMVQSVQQVNQALDEAIQVSRSLTVELSPPILYDAGLAQALAWLGRWMQEQHGLDVKVQADPIADPKPEDIRISLFLATRELLLNVVKHAGVSHATVSMNLSGDGRTRIIVSDSGVGFDPNVAGKTLGGFGLFGIRERLEMLGGNLDVQSTPGNGTRVTLLGPSTRLTARGTGPAATGGAAEKERTRVLIADDHAIVRDGLIRLLEACPDIEVVGQVADGQAAVEMALQMLPDVVIMDVSMPRLNGVDATRRILAETRQTRVIGLSMHTEEEMAIRMREAGAIAYLAKSGPPDYLIDAIRECGSGTPAASMD